MTGQVGASTDPGFLKYPTELAKTVSTVPGTPPADPADRIIAATAREYGFTVVTRDAKLLSYAGEGHLKALPC